MSDDWRAALIDRLKQRNEALKQEAAELQAEEMANNEKLARLGSPLPEPDLCPQCYYLHGIRSPLRPIEHPNSERFDRIECRRCRHHVDNPV